MVPAIENAVNALSALPTIGKKSAWRLALFLLERPADECETLARSILELKRSVTVCSRCFNYSEAAVCSICSSTTRDQSIVCVVEKPADVFTIEKSGRFRGVYHVLGGVLSPINGISADKLKINELKQRVADEKPREVIVGLGGSGDAEATSLYLARLLSYSGIKITRFARGLPAGMDLEYADQLTLTQALNERTSIEYSGN